MRKIIEEEIVFKTRCPHCKTMFSFEPEDVYATYLRGLEMDGDGWYDCDCKWHYVHCPNCERLISVDEEVHEHRDLWKD